MTAQTSDIILDRMMSLHPKIIDLTLDRMWRILAALESSDEANARDAASASSVSACRDSTSM